MTGMLKNFIDGLAAPTNLPEVSRVPYHDQPQEAVAFFLRLMKHKENRRLVEKQTQFETNAEYDARFTGYNQQIAGLYHVILELRSSQEDGFRYDLSTEVLSVLGGKIGGHAHPCQVEVAIAREERQREVQNTYGARFTARETTVNHYSVVLNRGSRYYTTVLRNLGNGTSDLSFALSLTLRRAEATLVAKRLRLILVLRIRGAFDILSDYSWAGDVEPTVGRPHTESTGYYYLIGAEPVSLLLVDPQERLRYSAWHIPDAT